MTEIPNPEELFAGNHPGEIASRLIATIPESEGENKPHYEDACRLTTALMFPLTELHEKGEIKLSLEAVRDSLALTHSGLTRIVEHQDISDFSRSALSAVLTDFGWDKEKPIAEQSREFRLRFGYARGYMALGALMYAGCDLEALKQQKRKEEQS